MRNFIPWTIFLTLIIIPGCSSRSVYQLNVIEKYAINLRYKSDTIVFRENNVFTRKINYMGFPTNYFGYYTNLHDTIFLQYHNSKGPKKELSFLLRKGNSIMILEIYDKIKDKYSNYSADQLNKVDKKDLMTKDTVTIEFKINGH